MSPLHSALFKGRAVSPLRSPRSPKLGAFDAAKSRSWLVAGNSQAGMSDPGTGRRNSMYVSGSLKRRGSRTRKQSSTFSSSMPMLPFEEGERGGDGGEEVDNSYVERVLRTIPLLEGFKHLPMLDKFLTADSVTRMNNKKDFNVVSFSLVDAAVSEGTHDFTHSGEQWAAMATQVVAICQMRHPNVAVVASICEKYGVFALVQTPGRPLKMHYEDALSSESYGSTPPFTPHMILGWALNLCSAVKYLHQQENALLHRSISPDNCTLDPGTLDLRLGGVASVAILFPELAVEKEPGNYKLNCLLDADHRCDGGVEGLVFGPSGNLD